MTLRILSLLIVFTLLTGYLFAQWDPNPAINLNISNANGEDAMPKVETTTDGGCYISWFSNSTGNYNVMLQKLDADGYSLWEDGGILISDNQSMTWLTDWDMTVDQDNNAILFFQDIRNGNNDVFIYKISPEGEFLWGENGIELSDDAAFDAGTVLAVTTNNNIVAAWYAETTVRMQKFNPGGEFLWGDDGLIIESAEVSYTWPQLLSVEDDAVILKYFEDSGPVWAPNRGIFARKIDENGNSVWGDDLVISNAYGVSAWDQIFSLKSTPDGGFAIAWNDDRNMEMLNHSYLQYIDREGNIVFEQNGLLLSNLNENQFYPSLHAVEDGIFIFWNESDSNQNDRGVFGQFVSYSGELMWSDSAAEIISLGTTNPFVIDIVGIDENATIIIDDNPNGSDMLSRIFSKKIDASAEEVWEEDLVISSELHQKLHYDVSAWNENQCILVWEGVTDNRDIYAQNIEETAVGNYEEISAPIAISNYPNPFILGNSRSNGTTINYSVDIEGLVNVDVFNVKGQKIRNLVNEKHQPGTFTVSWDGKNSSNSYVSSGIYFYKVKTSKFEVVNKLVLLNQK